MKSLITLVSIFIFIYPIFLKFLPIPFDRILQIFGFFLIFFNTKDLKRVVSNRQFLSFFSITFILLILSFLPQYQLTGSSDTYFIKTIIDIFLTFFSAYFVYFVVSKNSNQNPFIYLLELIVLVAVIQTVISALFFISNGLFDIYSSILKEDTNEKLFNRISTLNKRFIGIGSQFFSGVIKYGFAFLAALLLPYISKAKWVSNKTIYGIAVSLIILGGLLTGRTFFVVILLGLLMLVFINSNSIVKIIKLNFKLIFAIMIFGPLIYFIASVFLEQGRLEVIGDYVFELFINFSNEGTLSTSSSDATISMYKFPESTKTWLFGDGLMINQDGTYYMRTDVGYIRLLFYFGLPSTIIFVLIILKYQKTLSKLTGNRKIKIFFLFTAIWLLVLNFKGLTVDLQYFVIFLVFLIFSNKKDVKLETIV